MGVCQNVSSGKTFDMEDKSSYGTILPSFDKLVTDVYATVEEVPSEEPTTDEETE